jgi:hypothetical protein
MKKLVRAHQNILSNIDSKKKEALHYKYCEKSASVVNYRQLQKRPSAYHPRASCQSSSARGQSGDEASLVDRGWH